MLLNKDSQGKNGGIKKKKKVLDQTDYGWTPVIKWLELNMLRVDGSVWLNKCNPSQEHCIFNDITAFDADRSHWGR